MSFAHLIIKEHEFPLKGALEKTSKTIQGENTKTIGCSDQ
jgi:hypothetical protein